MNTHVGLHIGKPSTDFEVEMMDEEQLRGQVGEMTDEDLIRACVSITHMRMFTEVMNAAKQIAAGRPELTVLSFAVAVSQDFSQRCQMLHGDDCACRGCDFDTFTNLIAVITSLWSRMRLVVMPS